MDSGRRVWKWAGAVLAVLCAALGLCHFLLTQFDENSSAFETYPPAIPSSEVSGNAVATTHTPQGGIASAPTGQGIIPDFRSEISDQAHRPASAGHDTRKRGSQIRDSQIPESSDTRQSEIIQSIKPLGVVEKSDGRVQAVIADGEWTRLVEEGEVLADHSRVVKVSAEGVEILLPNSHSKVELARTESPIQPAAKSEIALASADAAAPEVERETAAKRERAQLNPQRAASRQRTLENELPGMEAADASYHVVPSKQPLPAVLRDEPATIDSLRKDAPPPTEPGTGNRPSDHEPLGRVEHSDGRVEFVIPDGQWVRLTPERPVSLESAEPNTNPVVVPASPPLSELKPVGAMPPATEAIQNSESPIPNSGQALGFVEWAGGRTRAIVSEAGSVEIVDDAARLAEARRVLSHFPGSGEPAGDSGAFSAEMPGRQREDDGVGLVVVESELATRGPPGEPEAALGLPEEIARGHPEDEGTITLSRAPPATEWEELPGISEVAIGRIEPLSSISFAPEAILGTLSGAPARSVSEIHLSDAENAGQDPSRAPQTQPSSAPNTPRVHARDARVHSEVLGVVRYLDGRTRTVVALNDELLLLEEGHSVPEISPGASGDAEKVIFTSQGSTVTPAGQNLASHPEVEESHPNLEEPTGSGLQTQPRLRDNRKQTRR